MLKTFSEMLSSHKAGIKSGICASIPGTKSQIQKIENEISYSTERKNGLVSEASRKRKSRAAKKRQINRLKSILKLLPRSAD